MIDEVDTNGDGAVDFEGISFHIHINSQRSHNLCFVPEFVHSCRELEWQGQKSIEGFRN